MLLRYELPQISEATEFVQNKQNWSKLPLFGSIGSSSAPSSFDNLMEKLGDSIPVLLQLIGIRCIGINPVILVPIRDSLDTDVIVLSDKLWFLHVARHSIVFTSISFQLATHATLVCSFDCPNGILFVADNSLHLSELGNGNRFNVRKFSVEGTPREVLYHKECKTVLILRIGLRGASFSSDIYRVDPLSGALLSRFQCEPGETTKSMQTMSVRYQHLLIVGTSQCSGQVIMPAGEVEREPADDNGEKLTPPDNTAGTVMHVTTEIHPDELEYGAGRPEDYYGNSTPTNEDFS